jgi:predicted MFS family arabinose efflux permease
MFSVRFFSIMAWLMASVFYAYQYILRVMPNIMLDDIMNQFQLDTKTFGQFSGLYYIGYCLMHLPLGILLDRFGPKKIMPICILMTVVGTLPILFSTFWVYPLLGRLVLGMGSSAAILCAFKIIRITFQQKYFTRMLSLSVTIGLIGAIYGGGPVSYMYSVWGYKPVVSFFVLLGVALSILTYFLVPEMKAEKTSSVLGDIREALSNKKVLAMCLFAGLMVGPLEGFADVWGTAYLTQVYGIEKTLGASLTSMIFVGMCFGAPLLSYMAEKTNQYMVTIILAGALMSLSFSVLLFFKLSTVSLGIVFTIVGVCCSYQILAIFKTSTYVRENVAGLTTAVANMIIMLFGYFFHTTIGWAVDQFGGIHSSKAFLFGIGVIPTALIIGVIGFSLIALHDRKIKQGKLVTVGA